MFPRLFALALCLAATPALAITVQHGDYFPELLVNDEAPFLMTGGQVDHLILFGLGPYEVQGGQVGSIQLEFGDLFVRGGRIVHGISRSDEFGVHDFTEITFEGRYFRLFDRAKQEHNSYIIEGWLSDGSFMSIHLTNAIEEATLRLPIHFVIVPGETPIGDADGDWDVDLDDLNIIRNNFGSEGAGDLDNSGIVDLDDLNVVRNQFGEGNFELDSENPSSWPYAEITESVTVSWPPLPGSTSVPEPCTGALALLLAAIFVIHRGFRAP